jgi:DNA replication protein DnaC
MTTNNIYTQLSDNLSKLGLSQIKLHFEKISSDITSNKISLTEGLLRLTNYEIDYKQKSAAMSIVKVAAFPYLKELKDFDFEFQPSINQQQILELANLGFINKAENIVFLGSSGVGKTHLATSIGIAAAKQRIGTYFIKCNDLFMQLKKAKLENRLDARLKNYAKYKLLIIDEIGYLPISQEDSNLFFQLIDMRYEKKSTIFTTNISFDKWDKVFYDAVVANAILDRILHHCHVIPVTGKSFRLKDCISLSD